MMNHRPPNSNAAPSSAAGTLSGGERKMLARGRALLGEPHPLMLDEPTKGVWHCAYRSIAR